MSKITGQIARDKEIKTNLNELIDNTNGIATIDVTSNAYTLSASEALCRTIKCSGTATGAVTVTVPATYASEGKTFIVRNISGQAVTVKLGTSTGVSVASTKSAFIQSTGSDFVKLTADN